ncbi:MAG: PTS sugar transporter subunit IIA [Opitutus sp.]
MPFRTLNADELSHYLSLTRADIDRLVKEGSIPFEKRGDRVVFRKTPIDAWASQRILKLSGQRLAEYHQKSSRHPRKVLRHEALLPEMLVPGGIAPAMAAKTKSSVVREMAALADRTGLVCDLPELVGSLLAREELCSTAMPGSVAFLHPRQVQPDLFLSSFLVLGRTIQPIHFGAPDGNPTRLFFLLCCQDDRLHLHTLARLCMMMQKTGLQADLLAGPDAPALHERLLAAERAVIESPGGASGQRLSRRPALQGGPIAT